MKNFSAPCPYVLSGLFLLFVPMNLPSTSAEFNYDETKVPKFELPDPLVMADGTRVTTARQWVEQRRPEIVKLFDEQMYGRPAPKPEELSWKAGEAVEVLGGKALRREIEVNLFGKDNGPSMTILLYLPRNESDSERPAPVFLGMNFGGNHSTTKDPTVALSPNWLPKRYPGVKNNRATEAARGSKASRWPVELVIHRGYGMATVYCGDLDPDFHDGWTNGAHAVTGKPGAGEWGSISTWAWGLSRALDVFEEMEAVNHNQVAVLGHSRLGKTAMWAGARDERFALVISNNSGCGGAALSKRRFGETVKRINTSFPHWFCENFKQYNDNEEALPFDQHMLAALVAPRPFYAASATGDRWADPRGEFLSCLYAGPVYGLFGKKGLSSSEMPKPGRAMHSDVGYHLREGKHDITAEDWRHYLDFADRHFGTR